MTSVRWLAPAILWSAILSVPLLAETPSPGKPINPEQLVHLDESDPIPVRFDERVPRRMHQCCAENYQKNRAQHRYPRARQVYPRV